MGQLVQLQKHARDIDQLNADVYVIFREEREGIDGLRKIRERTDTTFTLLTDLDGKNSAAYSPKPRTFDNYVISREGKIVALVPGTLKTRASAEQILKHLRQLQSDQPQ